jgi:Reverse transcriptase (RNA-dependent DNA polymerase)
LYSNNCFFVHNDYGVIVTIYVDNLLILSNELTKVNEIKGWLLKEFEIIDMVELRYFVGIQVYRDRPASPSISAK